MRKPKAPNEPVAAVEPIEISGPYKSAWHAMGAPEADGMVAKARLVTALQRAIRAAGLKQSEAAERLGMPQSNLSRLLSGRFRAVSFDQLFKLLAKMGLDVRVSLVPASPGMAGELVLDDHRARGTSS